MNIIGVAADVVLALAIAAAAAAAAAAVAAEDKGFIMTARYRLLIAGLLISFKPGKCPRLSCHRIDNLVIRLPIPYPRRQTRQFA